MSRLPLVVDFLATNYATMSSMCNDQLSTPIYVIGFGNIEVVALGIQWLLTLSTISMNFDELFLQFQQDNHISTLYGMNNALTRIISSHEMEKVLKKGSRVSLPISIVKDKFLVLVIKELMDELNWVGYLSKVYLCFGYHQIKL